MALSKCPGLFALKLCALTLSAPKPQKRNTWCAFTRVFGVCDNSLGKLQNKVHNVNKQIYLWRQTKQQINKNTQELYLLTELECRLNEADAQFQPPKKCPH